MVAIAAIAESAAVVLWKNLFGVVPGEDASAVANTTLPVREKFRRRLRSAREAIPP